MQPAVPSNKNETLREFLHRHGLHSDVRDGWLFPRGQLPAIRAVWQEDQQFGRLDIEVLLASGGVLQECFAGVGTGAVGIADAFENFMLNSLHVLLSALWGITDGDQVLSEAWRVGDKCFDATIGNIGGRASAGVKVSPPLGLFEAIQAQICSQELTNDIHWFRVFFCNLAGEHTYEALRDNEVWQEGLAALRTLPWPATMGYYSYRIFLILRCTERLVNSPQHVQPHHPLCE